MEYSISSTGTGTILREFGSYTVCASAERPPVEDAIEALLDLGGEAGVLGSGLLAG